MQVLGDVGAAQKSENSAAARAFGRMSRGQFLKGVGGAVVGMSVLSGVGSLATPAAAQEQAPQSVGLKEFKGGRLRNAVREAAEYADVQNVAPDDVARIANHDGADAKAGIHTLENGDKMLAVAVPLSGDRVLTYYETRRTPVKRGPVEKSHDGPVKRGRVDKVVETEAKVYRIEGENAVLDGNPSHNGRPDKPVPGRSGEIGPNYPIPPGGGGRCGGCGAPGATYDYTESFACGNVSYRCVAAYCTYCSYAIEYGPEAVFGCLAVVCFFAITLCCDYTYTTCGACATTL